MSPAAARVASTVKPTSVHPSFWKATFEEHGGAVLAFLVSRVGRREVGEDLLQETFVRAMRAGALKDVSKARSYLFSIAYRLVVDHVRKRRPVLFTEILAEEAVENLTDERAQSPDERAEIGLIEDRLAEAVGALNEPLRFAFTAAVIEQRAYADMASERGWSLGQVRVNVHRARQRVVLRMRELLQLDPGDEP